MGDFWNEAKVHDVSRRFDTEIAQRLRALKTMKDPAKRSVSDYLKACVDFSAERENIFREILHTARDDEPKRAELQDLSLTLFRKVLHHLGADRLNLFSQDRGFFVYNQLKPRSIAVVPGQGEKHNHYMLIDGIRMRSMDPRLLNNLARIGYLPDHTAYLQPKVLDHDEYEHLIDLLERELKEEGGEAHGPPEGYIIGQRQPGRADKTV